MDSGFFSLYFYFLLFFLICVCLHPCTCARFVGEDSRTLAQLSCSLKNLYYLFNLTLELNVPECQAGDSIIEGNSSKLNSNTTVKCWVVSSCQKENEKKKKNAIRKERTLCGSTHVALFYVHLKLAPCLLPG